MPIPIAIGRDISKTTILRFLSASGGIEMTIPETIAKQTDPLLTIAFKLI